MFAALAVDCYSSSPQGLSLMYVMCCCYPTIVALHMPYMVYSNHFAVALGKRMLATSRLTTTLKF